MPTLFQLKSYLTYWLDAVDEHSLHSPFFFDLHTKVVTTAIDKEGYQPYEALRGKLLDNQQTIAIADPGAGSIPLKGNLRKVADIAATSITPQKYSALYARIIRHFGCKHIVELGTSFGINALYLASAPGARVTTFEGSRAIASIAQTTFGFAQAQNIRLVEGNIDTTLPAYLLDSPKVDLAFIDANHRYEPTLRYANGLIRKAHSKSMLIVDDIHYSPEMEKAWKVLKQHELVYASADLFRCGILFFDPSLNKQHVVLQF